LAFRGGTALHKLYLKPPARYSEDIDLVQLYHEPIGPLLKRINQAIDFFPGKRQTQIKEHNAKIYYKFLAEYEDIPLRLKIEINTREHFFVKELVSYPLEVKGEWFEGKADINVFHLNELIATKLRALYQRNKGRDLFDLYYAAHKTKINLEEAVKIFKQYFRNDPPPGRKAFERNMFQKRLNPDFLKDTEGLLRAELHYNPLEAFDWFFEKVIPLL